MWHDKAYRPVSRSPHRIKEVREDHHEVILRDKKEIVDMYSRSFAGIVVDRSKPGPKALTKIKTPVKASTETKQVGAEREEYCVIYGLIGVNEDHLTFLDHSPRS